MGKDAKGKAKGKTRAAKRVKPRAFVAFGKIFFLCLTKWSIFFLLWAGFFLFLYRIKDFFLLLIFP